MRRRGNSAGGGFFRRRVHSGLGEYFAMPRCRAFGQLRLRTARTERLAQAELEPEGGWAIRRATAEQSNTSIGVGENAIPKVIRKLESGVHPKLEVSRFLTETAGFSATPSLLAWAELDGAASRPGAMMLSVLQSFVLNDGDGWSWVIEHLARAKNRKRAAAWGFGELTTWLKQLG